MNIEKYNRDKNIKTSNLMQSTSILFLFILFYLFFIMDLFKDLP
jgi:hypothetical protein